MTSNITRKKAVIPFIVLTLCIIWAMIIRPMIFHLPSIPLEIVFLITSVITIGFLLSIGIKWETIEKSIGNKTKSALPAIHMLLWIGLLVGSWVISGTIPMFVYYGLKFINPSYIYIIAFVLCAVFSLLTGTSWGSAGTIGVVLVSIGLAVNANMGILAAAIISGCYFGDKQSPISDTTIMAAMGSGVDVRDHVSSMLRTTGPSFVIAAILYIGIGLFQNLQVIDTTIFVKPILDSLDSIFKFSMLLILPPVIILVGSIMRKSSLIITTVSCAVACALALTIQKFSFNDLITTLASGFNVSMITWESDIPQNVQVILTRGGLASMQNAVTITIFVFMFIGAIDVVKSMEIVMDMLFRNVKSRSGTIIASLCSSALINGTTSNQYATAMIVGNAFQHRYDKLCIPRKVLSRSIEDYGTLIEPVLPWTTTGVYMATTLSVSYVTFVPYLFMNYINFVLAPTIAILGIGCFYKEKKNK